MNKSIKSLFTFFLIMLSTFILIACTEEEEKIDEEPIEQVEVVFVMNEGTPAVPKQIIDKGGTATKPTQDPTRSGYNFAGWYEEKNFITEFNFNKEINVDTMIYAKWNPATVPNVEFSVTFDYDNDKEPLVTTVAENDKVSRPEDPTKSGYTFIDWFLNDAIYDFDTKIKENIIIKAHWIVDSPASDVTQISSNEDFLALLKKGGDGKYELTKDLDFKDLSIDGSTSDFSGTLDGNGFTISNLNAVGTANKQGALFKRVVGGTIKNIKFSNSSMTSGGNGEGTAFIAYAAHGSATFDNLEFTNVKVIGTGSYTSLVFADNADDKDGDATKILNRITVINNSDNSIIGSSYTGGLIGHLRVKSIVNLSFIYFDSKVQSNNPALNQVAGSLIGRIQGANSEVTVNQAVIKGSVEATKNVAAIIGTSVVGKLVAKNIYVEKFNASVSEGNKIDTLVGNVNSMTLEFENVYFNKETAKFTAVNSSHMPTQGTGIEQSTINQNWFESSGLSSSYFKLDNDIVVLNRVTGPKTEEGISIISDSIKTTYHINEAMDLSTLIVKLNFSDGSSQSILSGLYTIDDSQVDLTQPGVYYLEVSYKTFTAVIKITVVDVTDFTVHTLDFNHVFLLDSNSINLQGIVVTASLSDDSIMLLTSNDYQISTELVNLKNEGSYDILVTYRDFEVQKIKVFVSKKISEDNLVVIVDQNQTDNLGVLNDDYEITFSSIQAAINYLTRLNLDSSFKKVIYVKDGIYYEKLSVSIPNLTMIGESRDSTIITYGAAAGTRNPQGSTWGTQGSATLSIKQQAENFALARITVENSFDYFGSNISDKQAVAIVNEADKVIYTQVNVKGIQDTLYAKQGRQWYIDNYIEGSVDYIFGNGGPAFFEQNTIHTIYRSNADGVITAQKGENTTGKLLAYGYVFYNNTLTTDNTARPVLFGRPWGSSAKVMFIQNEIQSNMSAGWTDMSGNKPENAFFFEHMNKSNGTVLNNTTYGRSMTETEAMNAINKSNVFAEVNGDDSFNGAWDYESHFEYVSLLLEK